MLAMANTLGISLDLFKKRFVRQRDNRYALVERKSKNGDYDCIFLKDKKCGVYQARPSQCRTFPWWPENLKSEESWQSAAQECEGIRPDAPLIPYSEIAKSFEP